MRLHHAFLMSTAGPGGAAPCSLSPQLFKAYTSYHKARFALAASLFRQAEEIVAQEAGDAELVSAYLRLLRASALDLQAQALHKADTERLRGEEFIELREEQWTHVKGAMGVLFGAKESQRTHRAAAKAAEQRWSLCAATPF